MVFFGPGCRKYLSYNLTPVAGVAAHMSRNGNVHVLSTDGCILSPLPLPLLTGLPVTIMGHFMVSHGGPRHLFNSLTPPDLTTNVDKSYHGSRASVEIVAAAWNKELLACVRDSYIELLQELQRLRQDPSTSRADPPIGRGLDGTYGMPAERAYSFWPRSRALISKGSEEPGAVDKHCFAEWLIKPMYVRLVELPMWQLQEGAMTKATDGMFLSPPDVERQGVAPPASVCDFLKTHYRVFAVPFELTKEMEAAGVNAKELTPKMLRTLLRIPSVAAAVPSIETQVDLLEFCCTDLLLMNDTSGPTSSPLTGSSINSERQPDGSDLQNDTPLLQRNSTRVPQVAAGASSIRSSRVPQQESRAVQRAPDGNPLEWLSDIGRAIADLSAGVLTDMNRDSEIAQVPAIASEDNSMLNKALVLELKGLLCPTAAVNRMVKLGVDELWVGSKEQQDLLPGMLLRFVHSLCVERSVLADLFHNQIFQNLLKLHAFSSELLAANLGAALPKHWLPRGAVAAAAPWVGWTAGNSNNSPTTGPSAEWIRMFWRNVNVTSTAELSLFSPWPLIPAVTSTPVLVRVAQRHLVFVPPVPERWLDHTGGEEDALTSSDLDGSTRGYLELERQHPWLLPLLRNCSIPVYDRQFIDCSALDICMPLPGKSLPQIVVSNFLALQQAGCLSPSDLALMPADCDALFSLFASCTSAAVSSIGSTPSVYSPEELNLLRSLPIYKTCQGGYVSLDQEVHCIVPPSVIIQPDDALCLEYRGISEGGSLYQALGIPELADYEVMARFALPGFEGQPEREQERILAYLYNNWSIYKEHESVVSALQETKFVRTEVSNQMNPGTRDVTLLVRPVDLMDPANPLLKQIFADEPYKFPGPKFATPGWLVILRAAGLRSSVDPPLLLECAKKVEIMGKESLENSELADDFEPEFNAGSNTGVSSEVWTSAGMLTEALLSNFASMYGTNFCEALGRIAFVPAQRGIPSSGGSAGSGRKVLASYNEAVISKDWPLAWTCAPILARSNVVPPEFSWPAFRLRHPPTFSTVVRHLQVYSHLDCLYILGVMCTCVADFI